MGKEQASRIQTSILNGVEKKALVWLAHRQPRWMTSDILTYIGVSGAIICAIYGILTNTWPTALLNMGLLIIQAVQLIRLYRMEKKEVTK